MNSLSKSVLSELLEPIPGDLPCGADLDIESEDCGAELLWLNDEMGKTAAIPAQSVDWDGVYARGRELYSKRYKSWPVTCYLVWAMFRSHGCVGLSVGLAFLRQAVDRFWPLLYPAPPQGLRKRERLLQWLLEGLAGDLAAISPNQDHLKDLQEAKSTLQVLENSLPERLGVKNIQGMRTLREQIAHHLERIDQGAQSPRLDSAHANQATQATKGSPVSAPSDEPHPLESPDQAERELGRLRSTLFRIADVLRSADPKDPRSYRLRRVAAWINIDADLPPNNSGVLAVSGGPEAGLLDRLRSDIERDALGVTAHVEGMLQTPPLFYWLDLQHVAYCALNRLGSDYGAAGTAVRTETAALLARAKGLEGLRFANQIPLADEATIDWLEGAVATSETRLPSVKSVESGETELLGIAVLEARKIASEGRFEESLTPFKAGAHNASGRTAEFRWRLATARHCMEQGKLELALVLLENLDQEGQERDLAGWEPELCLEILMTALELGDGRGKRDKGLPAVFDRIPDLAERLAHLDPAVAARWFG